MSRAQQRVLLLSYPPSVAKPRKCAARTLVPPKVYTMRPLSLLYPIQVLKVNVRLQGPIVDDYISEGIVQVELEGKWGYICPSEWTAVNSYVLCGQLGFPNTEKLESYSETVQDVEPVYWLDKVTCQGWESSIVSCDHAGWGRHQCEAGGALKIKCVRRKITKVSGCKMMFKLFKFCNTIKMWKFKWKLGISRRTYVFLRLFRALTTDCDFLFSTVTG